jgi:hypothetical protein
LRVAGRTADAGAGAPDSRRRRHSPKLDGEDALGTAASIHAATSASTLEVDQQRIAWILDPVRPAEARQ